MLSPQEIVSERNRKTAEQAAKLESNTNQKVMVEAIKQGFKEAIQELQGSTLKTRQLNIPAIQKIEGEVNVKNIPGLSELLGKLILTVANQEYPEMPEYPDVQKVEIQNHQAIPDIKFPEFPSEISAHIKSMPTDIQDKLGELISILQEKEFSPEFHIPATDLSEIVRALLPLQSGIEQLSQDMRDGSSLSLQGGSTSNRMLLKALKDIQTAVWDIPTTPMLKLPIDGASGDLKVLSMNTLVPKEYDALELYPAGASDPTGIRYWKGGVGGILMATVAFAYSGGELNTLTRS